MQLFLAVLALPLVATGCDRIFGLDGRSDPDARILFDDAPPGRDAPSDSAASCTLVERFDTTFADLSTRWTRYDGTAVPQATLDVKDDTLIFDLPIAAAENHTGIIRNVPLDLTGGSIHLEIVDPTTATNGFNLYIKLYDELQSNRYYQAIVDGTKLRFRQQAGPVALDDQPFKFDRSGDRHLRIRHDGAFLVLETSFDNVTYNARISRSIANVPIHKLRVEIGSGTYAIQPATLQPRVDNFEFCL